jgi:hypothetical protein
MPQSIYGLIIGKDIWHGQLLHMRLFREKPTRAGPARPAIPSPEPRSAPHRAGA